MTEQKPMSEEVDIEIFNIWMDSAEEAVTNPQPEPLEELPNEIEINSQEPVGTIIEYQGQQWLVTASSYISRQDTIDAEEINDVVLEVGWHSHLVKVHPGDKLLPTIAELVQSGEARFTDYNVILFSDEEYATLLSDLAYDVEIGVYNKSKLTKNPKWGGKRKGAGRPKQYVKIETKFYRELSEPEQLTPESDLSICLAEIENGQGIAIGEIWYGKEEALAIAHFIDQHCK